MDGDYLIIDEISYRFEKPERGDVVIFRYPLDPSQFFIKRIIGLPGETVKVQDGKVFVFNAEASNNEIALDESAYLDNVYTPGNLEMTLKDNEYFVLGDNRRASSDSRKWGTVPRKYVLGQTWLRAWPFSRLGVVGE